MSLCPFGLFFLFHQKKTHNELVQQDKNIMRHPKGKKYCNTHKELQQYRDSLKLSQCPACGRVGFLICHGFLKGYSTVGQDRIVRGRRFFCSNRFRKGGCGKTFSVFLADMLLGFIVTTGILWNFLLGIEADRSPKAAWESAAGNFSIESGYRLLRRLRESQSHLRTFLLKERPPPECDSDNSLVQLIAHFKTVFPLDACPFTQFQIHFQEALLR